MSRAGAVSRCDQAREAAPARRYVIERPFASDPTDPEQIEARALACGFCHGEPVGNAAVWIGGALHDGPLPCPRCGVTTEGDG